MASTACQRDVNTGVVFYVRLAKCSVDACLLVLCFFRSSFVSISNAFSLSQLDPALRFPSQQHIPTHSKQVQQHVTRPMQVDMFCFLTHNSRVQF
jgi:hypothetical protein